MKPSIILPNRSGNGDDEKITCENNIVLIGANGAGKSRLGSQIETSLIGITDAHRISAQRALSIPDYATRKSLEQAERGFFYGREDVHGNPTTKRGSRWGNNPETHLLNDFDQLLSTLFARTAKRNHDFVKKVEEQKCYFKVPDSPLDVIVRVWNDIMPHRKISFADDKVTTSKGEESYHGKGMSDGERVALYLIGQCLCVPDGSIVIIDEPEIHLHKSLMSRLWDKIETACPTKLIVFITHDLDFAVSRKGARKIWVKEYSGQKWIWDDIPEAEGIPESLVIEIAGTRTHLIRQQRL